MERTFEKRAMTILWTNQARNDYYRILDFLQVRWGFAHVVNFIEQTEKVLNLIRANPRMFVASQQRKKVRRGFITRQCCLFYQFENKRNEIILLTFWDNRQSPERVKL